MKRKQNSNYLLAAKSKYYLQTLVVFRVAGNKQEENTLKNFPRQSTCLLSSVDCYQTLDGGQNVIQLETAVGAAIKCFDNALGINVPRSRFLPVKTTSDLLLVMSNLYSLEAGSLTMSPKREFPTTPHVKLGSSFTQVIMITEKKAAKHLHELSFFISVFHLFLFSTH